MLEDVGKVEAACNGHGVVTSGIVPLFGEPEEDLSRDMEEVIDRARSQKNLDVDEIIPPPLPLPLPPEFPLDPDGVACTP